MNNRRNLLIALGASAFVPRALFAQSKQPVLIGWLSLRSRESGGRSFAVFKEGLAAFGWKDGSQIRIDERWTDGHDDRLTSFTQELAAKRPALIVASGLRAAVNAAKGAPQIPIVMVSSADPIAAGLVTNLGRPGGMITGLGGFNVDMGGKLLELLLAAAPKVKRVGFLADAGHANRADVIDAARRSAVRHSVVAHFEEAGGPDAVEPAMSRLIKAGVQGLVVLPGALLVTERRSILKIALMQRWPVVSESRAFAESGGLLSYGADGDASHRRAAYYVDRILKGAKPGDIPIEQPMVFEFVVNLNNAKALDVKLPPEIMLRADKVIE
jgi:putative ABC transport system substrate-binding protein